jgi:hypothetical protein
MLRSKLCLGAATGFQVVSLETLEYQAILDEADPSLRDICEARSEPVHMERIGSEFLLSYKDCSFFVNRNGWRAKPDWLIRWPSKPEKIVVTGPYILAFNPNSLHIWDLESASLLYKFPLTNLRLLDRSALQVSAVVESYYNLCDHPEILAISTDSVSRSCSPLTSTNKRALSRLSIDVRMGLDYPILSIQIRTGCIHLKVILESLPDRRQLSIPSPSRRPHPQRSQHLPVYGGKLSLQR